MTSAGESSISNSGDDVVRDYERQVRTDDAVRLEDYLSRRSDLRVSELKRLVQFDLVLRVGRPDARRVHQYLEAIPTLAEQLDVVLDLIDTELVLRCELGERPDAREYIERFPHLSADLELLFDVHLAETRAIDEFSTRSQELSNDHSRREETSPSPSGVSAKDVENATSFFPEETSEIVRCDSCRLPVSTEDDESDARGSCPSCGAPLPSREELPSTVRLMPYVLGKFQFDQREQSLEFVPRYVLSNRLGRGGFATVWRGRDVTLDRDVAIKMPRIDDRDRPERSDFVEEARAAARLRHPQILTVHEVDWYVARADERPPDDADRTICIVSELLHGRTLRQELDERGPMTHGQAVAFLNSVASALEHAHQSGVVHRDLKPENIMLVDGKPVLMDFGLARVEDRFRPEVDDDGRVVGTVKYMSPEQARGDQRRIDRRTDIFSLGMILYELVTGRVPCGSDWKAWYRRLVEGDFEIPSMSADGIPLDIQAICSRCLEKSPEDRYGSAGDLRRDLERYLNGFPVEARPVGPWERFGYWARRERRLAAYVATVAAALLLVAVVSSISLLLVSIAKRQVDETNAELARRNDELARTTADLRDSRQSLADSNRSLTAANRRISEANEQILERLRDARYSVDSALTGFADLLQYYPNTESAREFVLQVAAEQYERFTEQHGDLPELRMERARSLARLGQLRTDQGDTDGARSALLEAEQVLERIVSSAQADTTASIELAGVWTRLGRLEFVVGDARAAENRFRQARECLDGLSPEVGRRAAWSDAMATNALNWAMMRIQANEFSAAKELLAASVEHFAELGDESPPREVRALEGQAVAETLRGSVHLRLREFAEADASVGQAIAGLERLRQRAPDHLGYLFRLSETRLMRIGLLHELGRSVEEEAEYRRTLRDLQAMSDVLPSHLGTKELSATTRMHYGQLLHEIGSNHQALPELERSVNDLQDLADGFPEVVRYEEAAGTARVLLAAVLLDLGMSVPAGEQSSAAVETFDGLAREFDSPTYAELHAVALSHKARCLAMADDADGARRCFQEALSVLVRPGADESADDPPRRTLAHVHWRFGVFLRERADAEAAVPHFEAARNLWRSLCEEATPSVVDRRDYAWFLVCCPDPSFRNSRHAVRLVRSALQTSPGSEPLLEVLALAQLRAGQAEACAATLSDLRRSGREGNDRQAFILSMAQRLLGDGESARQSFERGSNWMRDNRPASLDSRLVRDEASMPTD